MSQCVTIVGAGVIGLATAYYAVQKGFEVTVIDQGTPMRDGTSFGNAGMIVPSHIMPLAAPGVVRQGLRWLSDPESPFYIKPRLDWDLFRWGWHFWRASTAARVARGAPILHALNMASKQCYQDMTTNLDDFELVSRGLLMLCNSDAGLEEEAHVAEHAQTLGMPAQILSQAEVAALEPDVEMNVVGGVYFPEDAHLEPRRFMSALQQWLEQHHVTFHWQTTVEGAIRESDTLRALHITSSTNTQQQLPIENLVLCTGSWSPTLAQSLGLRLPLQAGKGYSLTLPNAVIQPRHPAILSEAKVAISPFQQALRVGGTMELTGLDNSVNPRRVQGIINSACRYYPELSPDDFTDVPAWHGLRPCSPDGLPYLGRTQVADNLLMATGHAMMGLSLAPITGKLVSEVLAGEPTSLALTGLEPDRYAR
ncbi:MAG: FAD-dependent oxidoreductase [Deinococcota bacterium]